MYEIHITVGETGSTARKQASQRAFVTAHDRDLLTGEKPYYWEFDGVNLEREYGLRLISYDVGAPVPLIRTIDVPGRPGKLDATLAISL